MYIGSMQTENYISMPVVDQDWIVWIRINVILQRWKGNDVLIFCILERHFVRQIIFHVQTFYASTPLRLSLWAARWHPTGAHERTKRRDERCRVCFRELHVAQLHFALCLQDCEIGISLFAQRVTSILEIERSGFEVQLGRKYQAGFIPSSWIWLEIDDSTTYHFWIRGYV